MAFDYGTRDVTTTVSGGNPRSNDVGEPATLVLIGSGTTDGTTKADPNTVYDITTPSATRKAGAFFGQGSLLSVYVKEALRQPEAPSTVKAMAPAVLSVQADTPASNGGSLQEYPILTGPDHPITVTEGLDSTEVVHKIVYEHEPAIPESTDAHDVAINPKRGQVAQSASLTAPVEVAYDYHDYEGALSQSNSTLIDSIPEGEEGLIAVMDAAEGVTSLLAGSGSSDVPTGVLDRMRSEARGAKGLIAAEPNRTVNGLPDLVVDETATAPGPYSHQVDRRGMFIAGPDALSFAADSSGYTPYRTALAGLAGRMAGNALNNPVFGDELVGYGRLAQSLRGDGVDYLRNQGVMPLDDRRTGAGGRNLVIAGQTSTKQNPPYDDSYQFQRVIDRWIGDVHRAGSDLLGELAFEGFQEPTETRLRSRWLDYVDARVMQQTVSGAAAGGSGTGQQDTDPTAAGEEEQQEAFFITFEQVTPGNVVVGTGIAPTSTVTSVHNDVIVSTAAVIGENADAAVASESITIQG